MRQMGKAISFLTSVSILELFLRLVRTKCVAVFLGVAGVGFLSQLVLFFNTLRSWANLGTRRALVRQIASTKSYGVDDPRYREIITSSFFITLFVSGFLMLGVSAFAPAISRLLFVEASYYPYVIFTALMFPVACVTTLVGSVLKGHLEYSSFTKYTIAGYLGVIVLTPAAIYFFHYWGALLTQLIFFVFPLTGYLILNSKKRFLSFSRTVNVTVIREQFSDGINFIYMSVISDVPKLMLAAWITQNLGLEQNGFFQVIITVTSVYLLIPVQAITGYTLPLIASQNDNRDVTKTINDTIRFLLFAIMPFIIFLIVFPGIFIRIFYSAAFLPVAHFLAVQLIGAFFEILAAGYNPSLVAKGHMKPLYIVPTVHTAIYMGLSLALFKNYQLMGVAAAYATASFTAWLIEHYLVRHYFRFRLLPKNTKLVVFSITWLCLALGAAFTSKTLLLRSAVFLVAVPWFLLSSKNHERKFLMDKIKGLVSGQKQAQA